MPNVRTIRGVEILKVGTWECSNGTFTIAREDLESAVEFHRAGVLRPPPLRIGHDDPRFDGGPSLGHLDSLRLADGGDTLVADFVNVPAAIASLLPHAYRDRSIEGVYGYRDPTGRQWKFAITACALLGERAPAVSSLAQIGELYGVDIAAAASGRRVTIAASAFHPEDLDARRQRAVAVAAARRRRSHRTLTTTKTKG
jgi:hypothetical protein